MSYALAKPMSREEIPALDILGTPPDRLARQIYEACTRIGFFYAINHGVEPAAIRRTYEMAQRFYAMPAAVKESVRVNKNHRGWIPQGQARMKGAAKTDLKESFKYGLDLGPDDPDVKAGVPLTGPNIWPAAIPEMKSVVYPYFEGVMDAGRRILTSIALSLGLAPDFFTQRYTKPMARGGLLYYPPQPPEMGEDQFGVAAHTDYGCLTLLWQDDNGGLQVQNREGVWIEAPPIADSFVINVGDLLARWTNDRFASTPHRVVNRSGRERFSITAFFDPNYETVIDPREAGLPTGDAPHYPPVRAGDHILGRFDGSFAYRQ